MDCPDCPAQSQPSVACGSSVKYGTPVDCISCKLGNTYSDKYDKSQCKACTICSKGKAVKNNCTLSANTNCDKKCGHGFYPVPFIFSCLPCSQCCDDGKDELVTECTNYEKKCKVRSTRCTHVHTTPSKTTRRSYSTLSTLPTTQTVPFKRTDMTTMRTYGKETRVSNGFRLPITPTWSLDNEALRGDEDESETQDGTSIAVIMFEVVLALCLFLVVVMIIKKVRDMLRSSREENPNNGRHNIAQGIAPPQPSRSTSPQSSGSTSPLLYRSGGESPQLNGSSQPDGSASSQPNGSSPPQPSGSAPPQPSGSTSSQSNVSAPPQPNGSAPPQPDGPAPPQPSGSASSQPSGSASSQSNVSAPPQPNGSASSQPNPSKSPHPNGSVSAQSNRSAQLEDKSNPGESIVMRRNISRFNYQLISQRQGKEKIGDEKPVKWPYRIFKANVHLH